MTSKRTLAVGAGSLALIGALLLPQQLLAAEPVPQRLARAPDSEFRVLSWNVSRQSFFEQSAETVQLLAALDADILLLDEMPTTATPEGIERLLQRAHPEHRWNSVLGDVGGNRERASVSSRWPLRRDPHFDQLHYSRADIRRWSKAAGANGAALRRGLQMGMSTVAATIEIDGRRGLLVSFDMQCCGDSPDSWEEQRRRAEAQLLREALERCQQEHPSDWLIVGGDMNTVQGSAPLDLLRGSGLPSPLRTIEARHMGTQADWTWDGRGTPFPSRRMDYLLTSGAIDVRGAQVFDSEDLSPGQNAALGLHTSISHTLSAHRPIIADLSLPQR